MYLDQCMNAMFAVGDDFYKKGRAFIPKQPDTARVTCGSECKGECLLQLEP